MAEKLPQLDEQTRFAMHSMTMAAERRNRPRGRLMLSLVLLGMSVVAVGMGWRSHGSAQKQLTREASEAGQILTLADQIRVLQEAQAASGVEEEVPTSEGLSVAMVEQIAKTAGLQNFNHYPKGNSEIQGGQRILVYEYRGVRDESMETLVTWLRMVLERIEGVEVRSLALNKRTNMWEMTVRLSTLDGAM